MGTHVRLHLLVKFSTKIDLLSILQSKYKDYSKYQDFLTQMFKERNVFDNNYLTKNKLCEE